MKKANIHSAALLLFVNLVNSSVTNVSYILLFALKNISWRAPFLVVLGFALCIVQFALTNDFLSALKGVMLFLILWVVYKTKNELNDATIRSIHLSMIIIHSSAWVFFLITDFQFGRGRDGAFVGLFDEASVAGFVLGTLLLTSNKSSLLTSLTLIFLLMSKSLTGQAFIAWYFLTRKYFKYDFLLKFGLVSFAVFWLNHSTDLRINKELFVALSSLTDLGAVDVNERTSSSGFRILYEVVYAYEVMKGVSLENFLGGVSFPTRTASLNLVTEILVTVGSIGLALFTLIFIQHLKIFSLGLPRIGGIVMLFLSTGAFLKPVFIFCLILLVVKGGGNDIGKYNNVQQT